MAHRSAKLPRGSPTPSAVNIGSNYFLKDKQLTGELKKPFRILSTYASAKPQLPSRELCAAALARATAQRGGRNLFKVTPAGIEPAIFWMRTKCPGPLDDGAMDSIVSDY